MADHIRKQIRDEIQTALTGLATASTLYVGRTAPIDADHLPALVITTPSESVEIGSKGGGLKRSLNVEIAGHAQQAHGLWDTFDTIAKEIEAALATAAGLAAIALSVTLLETEVEVTGAPEQPAGLVRLTYEIVYQTTEAAPDVAL